MSLSSEMSSYMWFDDTRERPVRSALPSKNVFFGVVKQYGSASIHRQTNSIVKNMILFILSIIGILLQLLLLAINVYDLQSE